MANVWIEFVKSYASKNKMKYSEALKDPKLKIAYAKSQGKKKAVPAVKATGKRKPMKKGNVKDSEDSA
tara:strand:+ start:10009 stop:10212 length:204 start_codon:yes stop_codon:yes gene_type:complete